MNENENENKIKEILKRSQNTQGYYQTNKLHDNIKIVLDEKDEEIERLRKIISSCRDCSSVMKLKALEEENYAQANYWRDYEYQRFKKEEPK